MTTKATTVRDHTLNELVFAGVVGVVMAIVATPVMIRRVDEMLVTFMSILVAAAIPGIALTAAAPRPNSSSPLEAKRFGRALSEQVDFWFGFLWTGGLAVGAIIVGRALDWKLTFIPRPNFVPDFVPEGGAWLVLAASATTVFVAIRTRHIVTAVKSIIQTGTEVHADQSLARHKEVQDRVAAELAAQEDDKVRGSNVEGRQRH